MNNTMLWLQPVIAAFTGWLVAFTAIRMLFRQSHLQKMTAILGDVVARELIKPDGIAAQLNDPEALQALNPTIEKHLDNFLAVKLVEKLPVLSVFLGESTVQKIKEAMMEEIEQLLPVVITEYTGTLSRKVNIEQMVAGKLAEFSPEKLDQVLRAMLKSEFRYLQLMGAGSGFLIGLIQLVVTLL